MSVIKQNLSLKAISWLETALVDAMIKYGKQMDQKTIDELNELRLKTRQIKFAAHTNKTGVENNQLRGCLFYPYYEDNDINILKTKKTFNDIIKEFLNRR